MNKIDMHMHTCASDGTWDASELIDEIKKNNISVFSITDHDCVDSIEKMNEILVPKDNLLFIPGLELSTDYNGKEYHLTLYNYDINNKELLSLIKWTNENKVNTNKEYIINTAANKYSSVTLEEFEKYEYNRKRGGWKTANYMIDKGIHEDYVAHLAEFIKSGYKAKLKSPETVISIAKKSGGKIFLAHPSYHYRNSRMPESELKYWLELGIDGIECYSPYNIGNIEYYVDFCTKNNLMISGGSDCHGVFIPDRKLGQPHIELKDLSIKSILQ